jgi:diguanylate cyclase (GGDEF)-like protein
VRFALRAALNPAAVGEVLARQRWPADWTASVVDQRYVILARSRDLERYVGLEVTESLRALMRSGRSVSTEAITKDGVRVLAAVAPVGATGWTVAVGRPAGLLASELRDTLLVVGGAGSALVLAAAAASFLLGRRVARAVQVLAEGGDGRSSPIRELDSIHGRLDDAASRVQAAQAELFDARHDTLTGLPGRGLFLQQLAHMAADRRSDDTLAVLFVDLDGFKSINDRLGHDAGDRALVEVARVLTSHLRQGDLVGRLGGDEFVFAFRGPAATLQTACENVATRVIEGVGRLGHGLGCSVGMALQTNQEAPEEVLNRADRAMLEAKRHGKGRLQISQLPGPQALG